MNKTHSQSSKSANKKPSRPVAAPARPPGAERPSLAGERAEGEGMPAPAPRRDAAKKTAPAAPALEGEGNYTAARRYDEGVQRSVAQGDGDKLAEEAAEALDGPEGNELRKAEQAAKRGHAR